MTQQFKTLTNSSFRNLTVIQSDFNFPGSLRGCGHCWHPSFLRVSPFCLLRHSSCVYPSPHADFSSLPLLFNLNVLLDSIIGHLPITESLSGWSHVLLWLQLSHIAWSSINCSGASGPRSEYLIRHFLSRWPLGLPFSLRLSSSIFPLRSTP